MGEAAMKMAKRTLQNKTEPLINKITCSMLSGVHTTAQEHRMGLPCVSNVVRGGGYISYNWYMTS